MSFKPILCAIAFAEGGKALGTFTDGRDGKTYKTTKIGTQTWMAENLNYNASGSKCYGESKKVVVGYTDYDVLIVDTLSNTEIQANCEKYGRLYNWYTAIKACPSGWHLPSDAEWTTLTDFVGDSARTKLKANSSLWGSNGRGTDKFGFAALPGGGGNS